MAEPWDVQIGEIVQISPAIARGVEWFGACLMVVTEPKPWGVQGYVKNAGSPGHMYFRAPWAYIEPTGGKAVWIDQFAGSSEEGEDP